MLTGCVMCAFSRSEDDADRKALSRAKEQIARLESQLGQLKVTWGQWSVLDNYLCRSVSDSDSGTLGTREQQGEGWGRGDAVTGLRKGGVLAVVVSRWVLRLGGGWIQADLGRREGLGA
jgi:hypothetical protein